MYFHGLKFSQWLGALTFGVSALAGVGCGSPQSVDSSRQAETCGVDPQNRLLWRNYGTGQNISWVVDGLNLVKDENGYQVLSETSPWYPAIDGWNAGDETTDWDIKGSGDFDNDGKADILWRNNKTGEVRVWTHLGTNDKFFESHTLATRSDTSWDIRGVGHFQVAAWGARLPDDIVWVKVAPGAADYNHVKVWRMHPWSFSHDEVFVFTNDQTPAANWDLQAVGDLTGEGLADLVWYDKNTCEVAVWNTYLREGSTPAFRNLVSLGYCSGDMDWKVNGVANFNGANNLVWTKPVSGEVGVWQLIGEARAPGDYFTWFGQADPASWSFATTLAGSNNCQ